MDESLRITDLDAENILDILNDAKAQCLANHLDAMTEKKDSKAKWFKGHAEYIEELKNKVIFLLNTRQSADRHRR